MVPEGHYPDSQKTPPPKNFRMAKDFGGMTKQGYLTYCTTNIPRPHYGHIFNGLNFTIPDRM